MKNEIINVRALVLDSLVEFDRTGKKLDEIVHGTLQKQKELTPAQKGFYLRLTEGCVEQKIRLDHIIGSYSNTPVRKIRPVLLWILRMAVYQLSENDATPDSAAVNEAVKLAGKRGFAPLKGFVNAVLRSYLRDPEKVKWPDPSDPLRYLSVTYSMPEYLSDLFLQTYGFEKAEEICRAFLKEKPLAVHICQSGHEEAESVRELEKEDFLPEKAPYPEHAFFLRGKGNLSESASFKKGLFTVQDISSQLAVFAAGIKENDSVLDVCAAPGGKSMLAADLLNGTGSVLSRDVSRSKTGKIDENIKRLHFTNIRSEVFDAKEYDEKSQNRFDVVLADVPCSGYGVIGRKPDIKYSASAEKETALAKEGRAILNEAQKYVKPGGVLIFSTCTLSKRENEDNVRWFLERYPYHADSLNPFLPPQLHCTQSEEGMLQLLPDENRDGFFIARFVHD